MSWVQEVLRATEESEAPEDFFYWSALATLAAVARKSVYLDKFFYKLYPNIFVLLVARSGLRKGVPVALAQRITEEIKCTRTIVGRSSIQGIVKELGRAFTCADGTIIKDAYGFICNSEFSSSLVRDPVALTILTDLYDTHYRHRWDNTLAHSPVDHLREVCVTMVGATNEPHLIDAITASDIKGGFIARTFMVYEEKKRLSNPLTEKPKRLPNVKDLASYLYKVASAKGEFKYTNEAKKFFEEWYKEFDSKLKNDPTGTLERMDDSVLKVAMLLSLARDTELVLEEDDIRESLDRCMTCMQGMRQVIMGIGKGEQAENTRAVVKDLLRAPNHEMTRQKILIKHWGEFDYIDLDRIIENLSQANAITAERVGSAIVYRLAKKTVELYTKFKEEEQ